MGRLAAVVVRRRAAMGRGRPGAPGAVFRRQGDGDDGGRGAGVFAQGERVGSPAGRGDVFGRIRGDDQAAAAGDVHVCGRRGDAEDRREERGGAGRAGGGGASNYHRLRAEGGGPGAVAGRVVVGAVFVGA